MFKFHRSKWSKRRTIEFGQLLNVTTKSSRGLTNHNTRKLTHHNKYCEQFQTCSLLLQFKQYKKIIIRIRNVFYSVTSGFNQNRNNKWKWNKWSRNKERISSPLFSCCWATWRCNNKRRQQGALLRSVWRSSALTDRADFDESQQSVGAGEKKSLSIDVFTWVSFSINTSIGIDIINIGIDPPTSSEKQKCDTERLMLSNPEDHEGNFLKNNGASRRKKASWCSVPS